MANIYLRMPSYLAQFYRNRDTRQPLAEHEAVVFSPYQTESVIMASWLVLVPEQACEHTLCFSQRMWKNMTKGLHPPGGKPVFKRDASQWLTMDEVNALTGAARSKKYENSDYLCIQTPKVIAVGGEYKQVTPSFTLSQTAAGELLRQLRQEFVRIPLHWVQQELAMCDVKGIHRDTVACVDHFFYHYNIIIGVNPTDRDSMRRMALRCLDEARGLPDDIDDDDVTFIYENERQEQGKTVEEMIKEVQSSEFRGQS